MVNPRQRDPFQKWEWVWWRLVCTKFDVPLGEVKVCYVSVRTPPFIITVGVLSHAGPNLSPLTKDLQLHGCTPNNTPHQFEIPVRLMQRTLPAQKTAGYYKGSVFEGVGYFFSSEGGAGGGVPMEMDRPIVTEIKFG